MKNQKETGMLHHPENPPQPDSPKFQRIRIKGDAVCSMKIIRFFEDSNPEIQPEHSISACQFHCSK
jgi:hypothetical protein